MNQSMVLFQNDHCNAIETVSLRCQCTCDGGLIASEKKIEENLLKKEEKTGVLRHELNKYTACVNKIDIVTLK